jgi:L-threonate 2-dehydrogenase
MGTSRMMGAGLAKVLRGHGVDVLTTLAGRSAASASRAAAAGMRAVEATELVEADMLLSVLPPGQALAFAREMAPLLRGSARKPLFADCNAVSPQTVGAIAAVVEDTGCSFVDVGIIGLPPKPPGMEGPHLYAAGAGAPELAALKGYGLDVRVMRGSVGAASALKMSYAGITKGLLAVASAMILGATRAGVAEELEKELGESAPQLLERLSKGVPDMLPKVYRWVVEMQEIGEFVQPDVAAAAIYGGAARLFERIAADERGTRGEVAALEGFFGGAGKSGRFG